jgi:hypothetical protein
MAAPLGLIDKTMSKERAEAALANDDKFGGECYEAASLANECRKEGNLLSIVVSKLDKEIPTSTGTSRMSAFNEYIKTLSDKAKY